EPEWRDLVARMARRPGAAISRQDQEEIVKFLLFQASARTGQPAVPAPANPAPVEPRSSASQPATTRVAVLVDGMRIDALARFPAANVPAPAPRAASSGLELRWSGSGELLFWTGLSGTLRQPIFVGSDKNSTFKTTHFHPKLTATLGDRAMGYLEICATHPH